MGCAMRHRWDGGGEVLASVGAYIAISGSAWIIVIAMALTELMVGRVVGGKRLPDYIV
ncbi:hypothetical protein D3C75_1326120 [compost metagenome]